MLNQLEGSYLDRLEKKGNWYPIFYEGVFQTLAPAKEGWPNDDEFFLDAGLKPVSIPLGDKPLTPEELDLAYRSSISVGVVDHHFIDSRTLGRVGLTDRKCATKMVFDYCDDILVMIVGGRKKTNTHQKSDFDALASSFLLQALIQGEGKSANERLPAIAAELANLANGIDYGYHSLSSLDDFKKDLSGLFRLLTSFIEKKKQDDFNREASLSEKQEVVPIDKCTGKKTAEGERIFAQISQEGDQRLGRLAFDLFNEVSRQKFLDSDFSITSSCERIFSSAAGDLLAALNAGLEIWKENFRKFEEEWQKKSEMTIRVPTKEGYNREINMVIIPGTAMKTSETLGMALNRLPESIVAVFGGPNRASGENYNIGITSKLGEEVDLSNICVGLNEAEAKAREAMVRNNRSLEDILRIPEGARSPDEKKIILWQTGTERFGQSGVVVSTDISLDQKRAIQVVTRDPTVLVAGGNLVAASYTSVIGLEGFLEVLCSFRKSPE